jgi:hypothetical protein
MLSVSAQLIELCFITVHRSVSTQILYPTPYCVDTESVVLLKEDSSHILPLPLVLFFNVTAVTTATTPGLLLLPSLFFPVTFLLLCFYFPITSDEGCTLLTVFFYLHLILNKYSTIFFKLRYNCTVYYLFIC